MASSKQVTQKQLIPIARAISAGDLGQARAMIMRRLKRPMGAHWRRDLKKLVCVIDTSQAQFTVIARGNDKLGDKFLTWSTLPATESGGVACPGAGVCVDFCYSRKAWRYPAAFCRQAQNAILLQSVAGREQIAAAMDKQMAAGYTIFRLYVDGDFSGRAPVAGQNDFQFFMQKLSERPTLIAYGYSKSLDIVNRHRNCIPDNYKYNISSGSNASDETLRQARAHQAARGDFIAVTDVTVPRGGHSAPGHRQALVKHYRAQTGRKAFACPGKCNACTPNYGHACASDKFNGIDIIIAAH